MSKNWAASVRARLLELSKREGRTFQLILTRYFHERLLFRLSRSVYQPHFCLKGGTLLYAWGGLSSRPTKDIDLLGLHLSNNEVELQTIFRQVAAVAFPEDGVSFRQADLVAEEINKEGQYPGVRIYLLAQLDSIQQRIQIDIGFGDVVVPRPTTIHYPTLLEMEAPQILAYSVESVIAEKFEAMLDLAEANSRLKDFYDVYQLLGTQEYQAATLAQSIRETCYRRGTGYRQEHSLFTEAFALDENRNQQWQAFLRRAGIVMLLAFPEVMSRIRRNLQPVYESLKSDG
jgi:predicted nucleotidyltransferase component of viral defense system